MSTHSTHDVLVVGAGPAGLTTAVALARHGIDVLVVDRHAGTSPFPKATGVSTRTMEVLRSWGLDQRARAGAMRVRPVITVGDTLTGPEQATESFNYPTAEQALEASPTTPAYLPQDHLEPVLLNHLVERGGTVRFHTEVTGLQISEHGARARLRDRRTGHLSRVEARYLVGADGPRSTVRTALGIDYQTLGAIGDFVAVIFRAELAQWLPRVPGVLNSVQTPAGAGLFVPTDNDNRWVYGRQRPDGPFVAEDWTHERIVELLRAGSGLPDLDVRIESVLPFTMAGQVASALRRGPAFLVGDAAHRTTPMGGVGMNTAIHAAHNLGWKLAWVLRGWAGDALLDSYQTERLPVGVDNVRRSLDPTAHSRADGLARDIGYRYQGATVASDAGGRAPHAWVRDGDGSRLSTLDLFDGRLTVLTGPAGSGWRQAAARLAAGGLPITALTVGSELLPEDEAFAERYRLDPAGAVLVRPDGFVSWRRDGVATCPAAELAAGVARTLGRAAPAGSLAPAA
jgi:2-polyprenyl-6-methoxyphenol hydroxylase-like FAD-dependent oxidoreductase